MKKVQIISCAECGRAFAGCVEPYYKGADWTDEVTAYLKTGLVNVSIVDNNPGLLNSPSLDCCKKIQHA